MLGVFTKYSPLPLPEFNSSDLINRTTVFSIFITFFAVLNIQYPSGKFPGSNFSLPLDQPCILQNRTTPGT